MPGGLVVGVVDLDDVLHVPGRDVVLPPLPALPLHGVPEHLLAGVDPGRSSLRVGDAGGLPLCGEREGLVWGRLLVSGGHHVPEPANNLYIGFRTLSVQ